MRYKVALKKHSLRQLLLENFTLKKKACLMRDFLLLQAYKDRKELKTTYIFYSWSFKSRFLKEDFCCFVWDFGFFLHIKQSRAAEFPLFLFYRAAWS